MLIPSLKLSHREEKFYQIYTANPQSVSFAFISFGISFIVFGIRSQLEFVTQDFPGQIGRFSDGNREIVIRPVTEPTRKLHSASDCFEAVGYSTTPLPLKVDEAGKRWACFLAAKAEERLRVCERIEGDHGGEWTDVSSGYWSAWRDGQNAWWAFTVAER